MYVINTSKELTNLYRQYIPSHDNTKAIQLVNGIMYDNCIPMNIYTNVDYHDSLDVILSFLLYETLYQYMTDDIRNELKWIVEELTKFNTIYFPLSILDGTFFPKDECFTKLIQHIPKGINIVLPLWVLDVDNSDLNVLLSTLEQIDNSNTTLTNITSIADVVSSDVLQYVLSECTSDTVKHFIKTHLTD